MVEQMPRVGLICVNDGVPASRGMATFNKDLWEQWAVRYGGGIPFDG